MRKISPDLNSLFWTQFYGALNDNLFKSALVILITYKNIMLMGMNAGTLVAFCGAIFILPFFFISATSGQLADKYDKVRLSVIIKKGEVAIAILGVIGLIFENFPLMFFVLFLLGLQSTFFGPIKYSLIPHYSTKEQLVFSNALVSSGTFCAILLGTIIGGVAASFNGNYWPLIAILLLFAYLGLYYAKKLPPEVVSAEKAAVVVDWNLYTSTRDILKLVLRNPMVALLIMGLSWFWFMGAGLLSLMPLIAKNIFNGNEAVATMMLFIFTIGMGIGPFLLEKITKGRVQRWLIPMSLIAMTMMIFDLAYVIKQASKDSFLLSLSENPLGLKDFFGLKMSVRVVVDLFFLSVFGGMFTVPQFAELQRITDDGELSRMVAGNNIINSLAMVVISVILMVFHQQKYSLSLILGIMGFFNISMCIALLYFYKDEFNKLWRF